MRKVPDHLKPKDAPHVTVPIPSTGKRQFNLEHVRRLQHDLGLVAVNPERMKALSELGEESVNLGVVSGIHGSMLVTRDSLVQAIGMLSKVVEDVTGRYKESTKMKAARDMAYIAGALTKLNQGEIKVEQAIAETSLEMDKARRYSHRPGVKVEAEPVQV